MMVDNPTSSFIFFWKGEVRKGHLKNDSRTTNYKITMFKKLFEDTKENTDLISPETAINREFFDMKEAAVFLKVSISTMQKISASRLIHVYKPRKGKVYFTKNDLITYWNTGRLRTRNEIEQETLKQME
jgi:Helix-turn-helix domain